MIQEQYLKDIYGQKPGAYARLFSRTMFYGANNCSSFGWKINILPTPKVMEVGKGLMSFLNPYRDFVRHQPIRSDATSKISEVVDKLNYFTPDHSSVEALTLLLTI